MKTLFSKITKNIIIPLVVATAFAFNSYSQNIKETKDGFEQYNEKGQLIRQKVENNSQMSISDFEYDNKRNKVKERYIVDGNVDDKEDYIETILYEYDNKGNRIKKELRIDENADGKEDKIYTWLYEYDDKGNIIKEKKMIDINADGLIDKIEILK